MPIVKHVANFWKNDSVQHKNIIWTWNHLTKAAFGVTWLDIGLVDKKILLPPWIRLSTLLGLKDLIWSAGVRLNWSDSVIIK